MLGREVEVCRQLSESGAPVGTPIGPLHRGGPTAYPVSLWDRLEATGISGPAGELAAMLGQVHQGLRHVDVPLPSYRVAVDHARATLSDDARMAALPAEDLGLLRRAFDQWSADQWSADQWSAEVRADVRPHQPLHGEPHLGNVVVTRRGPVLIDFEAVCSGPLEWDLASLGPGVAQRFPEVDGDLLARARRLNQARVATWCWALSHDPSMRRHGEHHLAASAKPGPHSERRPGRQHGGVPLLRRVGVLTPMWAELGPLARTLSLAPSSLPGGPGFAGRMAGTEVVAMVAGVGTGSAADAAERLLEGDLDRVVVVGVAGGIDPAVPIGHVVIPEAVIDRASGTELVPSPLGRARPAQKLCTSDELILDPDEHARLVGQGVAALDMETAAVGSVCDGAGVAWSVVRAVSDRAQEGMVEEAVRNLARADGSPDLAAAGRYVAAHRLRSRRLIRLARDMRKAAEAAATSAVRELRWSTG